MSDERIAIRYIEQWDITTEWSHRYDWVWALPEIHIPWPVDPNAPVVRRDSGTTARLTHNP